MRGDKEEDGEVRGTYLETDTVSMKASRYDHVTGTCRAAPLSERFKKVGGHGVQRDLYSSFVTGHADKTLKHPDRDGCIRDFPGFLKMQEALIKKMKADGISRPQCFGF